MPRASTANSTADMAVDIDRTLRWLAMEDAGKKTLGKRLKEHGVEMLPYMPMADNVLVLRFPAPPVATKTKGGLYIPETSQVEEEPRSEGILVQAGCSARDIFRSHGILIGDRVQIGRFAGWEKEFGIDQIESTKRILQMKVWDVLGSFDLFERLYGAKPTMTMVWDATTEESRLVPLETDQ